MKYFAELFMNGGRSGIVRSGPFSHWLVGVFFAPLWSKVLNEGLEALSAPALTFGSALSAVPGAIAVSRAGSVATSIYT